MHQSYQTRLNSESYSETDEYWLNEYAKQFGSLERKLYSEIAAGTNAMTAKKKLMAEYEVNARQYNALRIGLKGKIDSVIELLKLEKKNLLKDIKSLAASVTRLKKQNTVITRDVLCLSKRKYELAQRSLYFKTQRLLRKRSRLEVVKTKLSLPVPGICFGTKKLFRQQFHLDKTDFANHAEWKLAWDSARNHQVFSLGSSDESNGNVSCQATVAEDGTLSLKLLMPKMLIARGAPKYITFTGLVFPYGHDRLLACLYRKGGPPALSYRFHRDSRGWRVFVSFDVEDEPVTSLDKLYGTVGVDFNADHLAWAETDRFGNVVDSGKVLFALAHKTTEQRDQALSDAVSVVVGIALDRNKPLAIEDLDFQEKKRTLSSLDGARYARMLSGLAVAKYKYFVESKCSRAGAEFMKVNPAYTSVAGRIKDAHRLGVSVHRAAAGMIARRGQGLRMKVNRAGTIMVPVKGRSVAFPLPARNRGELPSRSWLMISRELSQHCADIMRAQRKPRRPLSVKTGSV